MMREQTWFNVVAGVVALAVVAGLFLGASLSGGSATASGSTPPASPSVDHLYLTVAFNPVTGLDEYFPANFTVPAHTLVIVTITNYDNGTNPVPAAVANVIGTVGGTESVVYPGTSAATTVSSVDITDIAHTFSVPVAGGGYALNAPIPAAGPTGLPTTVSFGTYFNQTGDLVWMCMAPCDPGSMVTPGFMTGTITVTASGQ